MRANLPDSDYFINKIVPGTPDTIIVSKFASGHDAHLFRASSASLQRDLAVKIIPESNLEKDLSGKPIWKQQIEKPNALRSATVVKVDQILIWPDVPVRDSDSVAPCVVLVSEFISGPNLAEFIKKRRQEITISFIVSWLKTMLDLFYEMKFRNVKHGDLHPGNILVEDQSAFRLNPTKFVFRVTDFGVGDSESEPRFRDDYLQLGDILNSLLKCIDYAKCNGREKYTFQVLRDHFLARHLMETNPTIDYLAQNPEGLLEKLNEIDADYQKSILHASTKLLTPFDYLSCEQIGEASSLLKALYSERFLGLGEIEARNNLIVTGPRGCGKSTVFRSLSLDHRIRINEDKPEDIKYLGVYYRCDDLNFGFPRYKLPDRKEAYDIPTHFVTATLLLKLLEVVREWGTKYFEADFVDAEPVVVERIWAAIKIEPPGTPDALTFRAVIGKLSKERMRAAEKQLHSHDHNHPMERLFGVETLQSVCHLLLERLPFLEDRPVYFLIDDYSSPKVTRELQSNLNRIFMQRASVCFFKLSTESPVSFEKSDIDEKTYVESREYSLLNLGLTYLHADNTHKLAFIEDIFSRRLAHSATKLPASTLAELVGQKRSDSQNEIAEIIRSDKKYQYAGLETLGRLCSGDIHYVIRLVGQMVHISGGAEALKGKENAIPISESIQNKAIREEAGSFLKSLRSVPRCGEKLVSIVEAFGIVAYSHLRYIDSTNEESKPPKQATRIEPFEEFALSESAKLLYDELLRYSVFIEDFRGKSRRGKIVPRLYIRRFLIPYFNLTFSMRDSIELEPEDFERFLMDPNDFESRMKLAKRDDLKKLSKRSKEFAGQMELGLEGDYPENTDIHT